MSKKPWQTRRTRENAITKSRVIGNGSYEEYKAREAAKRAEELARREEERNTRPFNPVEVPKNWEVVSAKGGPVVASGLTHLQAIDYIKQHRHSDPHLVCRQLSSKA